MLTRAVAVPADPIRIARALADRPGLALLHTAAGDESPVSYVACDPDGASSTLDPLDGRAAPRAQPPEIASVPWYIGTLPYEEFRTLERACWSAPDDRPPALLATPSWRRYPAVLRIDSSGVVAIGEAAAVADLARRVERGVNTEPPPVRLDFSVAVADSDDVHAARVAATIELILAGDLYQANIARRIDLRLREGTSPPSSLAFLDLYARLAERAPARFNAAILGDDVAILSTSPELCLRADARADGGGFGALVTEPIKGTRPRGADATSDAALALELDTDEKERAELTMIIDVERNDLSRVSVVGSVRVDGAPRVVSHSTVHHRVATVRGIARPDTSRADVLRAFLPSGSVTGAPKVRAMEVIRTLEPFRRGLYTGAFGFLSHDGGMRLAMAIRTAVFANDDGRGEYFAGGGIVADSIPSREVEETKWKAIQLEIKQNG